MGTLDRIYIYYSNNSKIFHYIFFCIDAMPKTKKTSSSKKTQGQTRNLRRKSATSGRYPIRVQSVLLPKKGFTHSSADKWILNHKFSTSGFFSPKGSSFYHYRQHDPSLFESKSFRSKKVGRGIVFRFAIPKKVSYKKGKRTQKK